MCARACQFIQIMWLKLKQSIQKNYELALPWLALLLGFLFAYAFWKNEKQNAEFDQQIRFEYKVKEAKDLIYKHVEIYEQTLYGLQSFYKASDFVTEDEFNRYVGVLFDPKKYHGLKEVSFIKYVDINLPSSYQQFIPSMDVFLHQNGHSQHQPSVLAPKVYVVPSLRNASSYCVAPVKSRPLTKWILVVCHALPFQNSCILL